MATFGTRRAGERRSARGRSCGRRSPRASPLGSSRSTPSARETCRRLQRGERGVLQMVSRSTSPSPPLPSSRRRPHSSPLRRHRRRAWRRGACTGRRPRQPLLSTGRRHGFRQAKARRRRRLSTRPSSRTSTRCTSRPFLTRRTPSRRCPPRRLLQRRWRWRRRQHRRILPAHKRNSPTKDASRGQLPPLPSPQQSRLWQCPRLQLRCWFTVVAP